ncbi:MAG: FAD-dependent oxidoreductase [Bacteroidetes bacterium]|nr:FAD-dependent oxidoreductase [Bacteroidota bacterium]
MKKKIDFLLVGQGLAGSMLYWWLTQNGKNVLVVDRYHPFSSSRVAPGIIHPITGRRIVKTWMADTLIPFAEQTYRDIEKHFNETLFHKMNILELVHSVKEQNDWMMKSSSPEMKNYFSDENTNTLYNDVLQGEPKKISISQSGWLNIPGLIGFLRKEMESTESIWNEDFEHDSLAFHDDEVVYKNITASRIIFCEGYQAIHNPLWKHLPFLPAKGEVLTIRSEELSLDHILIKSMFILPCGNHLFKIGATYSWDELNETPTEKAKEHLLNLLHDVVDVSYEVVDHQAGVRPTVKNRRPFIGFHHEHKQAGIFNGLGTKGVLLAPYFANHFAEHLLGKTELMKEVNVARIN